MRLFIALDLNTLSRHFKSIQDDIRDIDIKATFPEEYHLTLHFIGDTDDDKVDAIADNLNSIKFCPFRLSLSDLGAFPGINHIRIIWQGVNQQEEIAGLAERITIAMDKEPDRRFHPHITLARVKHIKEKERLTCYLRKEPDKPEALITSFSLIKSTLTPQGPVYETLKEFRLNM